jgi:precorrin-2/cobalt-factor-2 C20-methyltransferase
LITVKALRAIRRADLVFVPVAAPGRPSAAESVIRAHADVEAVPVVFPMTRDAAKRGAALRGQLEELRPRWEEAVSVVLPVIGDSALYATAAYFYDVWKAIDPSMELELIPGVSAHSLSASRAGRFLALGDEVFSVVPGTAGREAVALALKNCDAAALYKPSALGEELRSVVESAGPWGEILRTDRAGLPEERLVEGIAALSCPDEYLSTLLLWRRSR